MGTTYTPSSLHESITTICKSILPFSFKKRRLPAIAAAEQRLSQQQSDNLKWQQESFHHILKLMGLSKEGIIGDDKVSDFKARVVEAITGLPVDYEAPVILRDKLIFLQDLLYAECITEAEYHASKRPLLQRLAVQGAKIRQRDVITEAHNGAPDEEWAVLYLKETEQRSVNSDSPMLPNRPNECPVICTLMEESSVSTRVPPVISISTTKLLSNELVSFEENPNESRPDSILMMEEALEEEPPAATFLNESADGKGKRKPFISLFKRNQKEEIEKSKLVKRNWSFDGFKKWMKNEGGYETAPLTVRSDDAGCNNGELLGESIKEEISRIKAELIADDAIEAAKNGPTKCSSWTTFDDGCDENAQPNLFTTNRSHCYSQSFKQDKFFSHSANTTTTTTSSLNTKSSRYGYNPFAEVEDYQTT